MGEGEQDSWTRRKKKVRVVDRTRNVKFCVPHPQDGGSAEAGRGSGARGRGAGGRGAGCRGGIVDGWLLQPCSRSFPPNSLVKDSLGEGKISRGLGVKLALQNRGGENGTEGMQATIAAK